MTDNSIYVLFTELQRQYPRYPVTMGQCSCGRMPSRGGGKCALCLAEELGKLTTPLLASQAHEAIREVARVWAEIEECAG